MGKELYSFIYKKAPICMFNLTLHHTKRDLIGIAKIIDPGQPAQSAQSDHGRNFLLLADFL